MNDETNSVDIELTAHIVSAYVSKNPVPTAELPALIASIAASLQSITTGPATQPHEPQTPAVPIKKSVTQGYIVCLDDGKKFKSLKRHIRTSHGVTPDEYRAKWGLPHDYPMVAPNYATARSQLAKAMGLGRKTSEKAPVKRGRKKPV